MRRLQLQHRAPRPRRCRAAHARRQGGQACCAWGARARTCCGASTAGRSCERVDLKGVKQVAFANAHGIANRLLALFEAGAFDVATLYFSEFKSVIAQKPTAQQLIPVKLPEATGAGGAAKSEAVYEYEPEENEILSYLLPRNISAQISAGCWRTPPPSRAHA